MVRHGSNVSMWVPPRHNGDQGFEGVVSGFEQGMIQRLGDFSRNSGGPLVSGNEVVGVNAAGVLFGAQNVGYAVPIVLWNLMEERLWDQIKRHWSPQQLEGFEKPQAGVVYARQHLGGRCRRCF